MIHTLALLIVLFIMEMDPKMRLDLSISENILSELINHTGTARSMVKGSHIPGYGVMFEVSVRLRLVRGQAPDFDFDAIAKKYFNEYADLIGGLSPDDIISITYNNVQTREQYVMSAKKRDVSERRGGRITEDALFSRIRTQKNGSSPDSEVFAKVLETIVNADTSKTFTLRNVTASGLPGYGLLVSGALSSGSYPGVYNLAATAVGTAPTNFTFSMDEIEIPEVPDIQIRQLSDSLRTIQTREVSRNMEQIRVEAAAMRDNINQIHVMRRRSAEEVKAAFDALEVNLKNAILNYGRTLSSLQAGQTLMVRITNERPSETLPNSITFTVPKQVLADYDRRTITKEQAITRIVVSKE